MRYTLLFLPVAKREWNKLGATVRGQFEDKLNQRLNAPRVEGSKLRGMPDCYKLKLRNAGYRLVYQVLDRQLIVTVVAVGRRDSGVYESSSGRID